MESNHECPLPTDSNIERASTSKEVLSKKSYGPNKEPVISYHKRYPDGEFVAVMLSPSYGFCPEDDELIVDYLNKKIDKEDAPYNRIPKVNVYNHTPQELAGTYVCFTCMLSFSTYEDLINFFDNLEVIDRFGIDISASVYGG